MHNAISPKNLHFKCNKNSLFRINRRLLNIKRVINHIMINFLCITIETHVVINDLYIKTVITFRQFKTHVCFLFQLATIIILSNCKVGKDAEDVAACQSVSILNS